MARPAAPVGAPKEPTGTADHRARLEAARDLIEARLADASDRDLSGLMGRYESVLDRLAAIPDTAKASDVDDLAGQRARRRAAAAAAQ